MFHHLLGHPIRSQKWKPFSDTCLMEKVCMSASKLWSVRDRKKTCESECVKGMLFSVFLSVCPYDETEFVICLCKLLPRSCVIGCVYAVCKILYKYCVMFSVCIFLSFFLSFTVTMTVSFIPYLNPVSLFFTYSLSLFYHLPKFLLN